MKCTKMIFALLLAMGLLLAGCGNVQFSATDGATGDTSSAGDSNQKWVWADKYEGTFSEQGYYYRQNLFLHYLDTTSGVTTALCTKAGCLHDQESCEAYLSGVSFALGGSCFWDGSLYYVDQGAYSLDLYRSNATGTEREAIGEVGAKYTGNQKSVTPKKYALADGFWYYCAKVDSVVWDEESGMWTNEQELNYIGRIDLRTGKEEILIEDRENTLTLCAAQEKAFLFTIQGVPEADIRDDSYREQLKALPISLRFWDGETGQVSTLFQKIGRECGGVDMVSGGKVYYSVAIEGSDGAYTVDRYAYDLTTGEDTLFVKGETMWYWGGGYARRWDTQSKGWYLFELESGQKMPIDIKKGNISLKSTTQRGCIFLWSILPEDASNKEGRYCYVAYESLADGLQEADLMIFYTQQYGAQ